MAKYTAGPWLNNGGIIGPEGCTSADSVCIVGEVNEQTPQNTANARLIVAAPDLLDACKKTRKRLENMTTLEFARGGEKAERESLDSAIMKAESQEL